MGTKNLTCAVIDGEYKIAQYGQWDGYPSGQGQKCLKFLLNEMDRPTFEAKLRELEEATWEEKKAAYVECGGKVSNDGKSVSLHPSVSDKFNHRYPQFFRDTGADIFKLVQAGLEPPKVDRDLGFANNSLFCEWAYVIDLDKNTFEVYRGRNKEPLDKSERFYNEAPPSKSASGGHYHPVKLFKSYPLDQLPSVKAFIAETGKICDDEKGAAAAVVETDS